MRHRHLSASSRGQGATSTPLSPPPHAAGTPSRAGLVWGCPSDPARLGGLQSRRAGLRPPAGIASLALGTAEGHAGRWEGWAAGLGCLPTAELRGSWLSEYLLRLKAVQLARGWEPPSKLPTPQQRPQPPATALTLASPCPRTFLGGCGVRRPVPVTAASLQEGAASLSAEQADFGPVPRSLPFF